MNFELFFYEKIEGVRENIKLCEGVHIQQVAYSTYHDALTQVCFGCMRVHTNMKEKVVLGK